MVGAVSLRRMSSRSSNVSAVQWFSEGRGGGSCISVQTCLCVFIALFPHSLSSSAVNMLYLSHASLDGVALKSLLISSACMFTARAPKRERSKSPSRSRSRSRSREREKSKSRSRSPSKERDRDSTKRR